MCDFPLISQQESESGQTNFKRKDEKNGLKSLGLNSSNPNEVTFQLIISKVINRSGTHIAITRHELNNLVKVF